MKKILFSVLIVVFSVTLNAQEKVALKMNLEKNRVYRLRSASTQTVTQTVNGVPQTTESEVTYSMSLKMLDSKPEFMVAEVRFDTIVTVTNTMGKVTTISSLTGGDITSSESDAVLSCIMNRLSKNALYVRFDYSGKPVEIVNARILPELVLKDTSGITLKGPVAQAVKNQIAEAVSEANLRTMIEQYTHFLPGREVAPGEQWIISQQTVSGGMMLDISTTYRFDRLNGGMAEITAESSIRASDNAVPIQSSGATVTYNDLKGMSRAAMTVNAATGMRVEETGKTHIAGNLGISAPGFSMQMPMDINGETKITGL